MHLLINEIRLRKLGRGQAQISADKKTAFIRARPRPLNLIPDWYWIRKSGFGDI
jgi:hypothetical protein